VTAETAGPAFAPGSHSIAAYGGGAFAFAGMRHAGSILATPRGVRPIAAQNIEELDASTLAPLLAEAIEAQGSIEFLVIGTGPTLKALPDAPRAALKGAGLRFETMATGPALRVYNVMRSEDRRVAAVLIAAP
jgi:uncharacterized protein